MLMMFRDTWRVGSEAGTASGGEATHGEKRIDFVFFKGENVNLIGVQTVDTASWFGAAASDHRPLVAVLRPTHVIK